MTEADNVIQGVVIKPLRRLDDARGWLIEILRADDPVFRTFGQAYLTTARPGVVKAWHCHARQTDYLTVVAGTARIALYDGRDGSSTRGAVYEIVAGMSNPVMVVVPPGVFHGYKPEGGEPATVLNLPTELYNYAVPDEIRRPYDDAGIPYDWGKADPASG